MEELTAIYLGEKLAFGDHDDPDRVIIGNARAINGSAKSIDSDFAIKGPAALDELTPRLTYRFYGRWKDYRNKRSGKTEKQFHFKTFVANQPHDQAGVCVYLGKAPWIGPKIAADLWRAFRSDAVRILREEPEVAAAAINRLTIEHAKEAAAFLEEQKHLEDCSIDLLNLLDRRGFPKTTAKKAIQLWGNAAPEIIRRNPYRLMNFRGCGFKRCDQMYLDLGLPPDRLLRQGLCAWYSVARQTDGDTWFPVTVAQRAIESTISGTNPNTDKALRFAWRSNLLAVYVDDGLDTWIAEDKNADAELYVARHVARSTKQENHWPDVSQVGEITDHQRAGLAAALHAPIGMFLGGPGTGKTWTLAHFVKFLQEHFGSDEVAVASPTNKAAGRARSVMAEHGVTCWVSSVHSLLGVNHGGTMDGGWSFLHNERNPLPFKAIVLDEGPMIDCGLMASILAARAPGTMLLIVGDTNQLPPIQHGAPVRDFIRSGMVPYGMLTEPQRNAGAIVQACDAIRKGEAWQSCDRLDLDCTPPKNLKLVDARTPEQQIERMLRVVQQAGDRGFERIWDLQVITATNATRRKINDLLQRELNPQGKAIEGNPFRVGDKVSCTENDTYKGADSDSDDDCSFVSKREIGRVVEVESNRVVVKFEYPDRTVIFPKGKSGKSESDDSSSDSNSDSRDSGDDKTGCALRLAYAETCHTMQGSETPWAIPILENSRGAMRICSREWFFTAISRGKMAATPIGQKIVADRMCKKVAIEKRKTFLSELIQEEVRGV